VHLTNKSVNSWDFFNCTVTNCIDTRPIRDFDQIIIVGFLKSLLFRAADKNEIETDTLVL